MTARSLIIAAHGSSQNPRANALITEFARHVRGLCPDMAEVITTFIKGTPRFESVLDHVSTHDVTVVPLMTSSGYYTAQVLPNALRNHPRFNSLTVRQTPPVGEHPMTTQWLRRRVPDVIRLFDLAPTETTIMVVGHGTERHKRSRSATVALVADLRRSLPAAEFNAAFLDEKPFVEEVFDAAVTQNVLVMPFLIGGGTHASTDIPRRLGIRTSHTDASPLQHSAGGRRVVIDTAVGAQPWIAEVIATLAQECIESTRVSQNADVAT